MLASRCSILDPIPSLAAWVGLALILATWGSTARASPPAQAAGAEGSTAPTVTVFALENGGGSEVGPAPGFFVFTRDGDTSQPLSVDFTLGGTATPSSDYLLWETRARFKAGASTCFVTVLPRNDSLQEGTEAIQVSLNQGEGYTVGTPDNASISVADVFFQGVPGVLDRREIDPQTGQRLISPDLTYLDAQVDPNAGALVIRVGVESSVAINNVVLYLDTDQNPATGDYRAGHVAGQEYRIEAATGIFSDYRLFRLRTEPPATTLEDPERDPVVLFGSASLSSGLLTLSIPLGALENPTAVDVFAITHIGISALVTPGVGDRAPDFGAFDTRSQQTVVRRPGVTQVVRLSDSQGDNVNGFDIVSAEFATVADQFFVTLGFSQGFDPTRPTLFPGPTGEVQLDTDRRLLTGGFFVGEEIPTWGGDVRLFYFMGRAPAPTVLVQPDNLGNQLAFGQDKNDGRWLVQGSVLFLSGSLSIYDPLLKIFDDAGELRVLRLATDGSMYAQVTTLGSNIVTETADELPERKGMVDTTNGNILQPFTWDPRIAVVPDPLEFPQPISGQDLMGVQAQIIEGNLVIKGILSAWSNTDTDNLFQVFLDTDDNVGTSRYGRIASGPGAPVIGVDSQFNLTSAPGIAPVYVAQLFFADGTAIRSDASMYVQPSFSLAQPGSFTITIPLEAIGNPSRLRLYLATGAFPGPGLLDVAPSEPLSLVVTSG